MKCPYCSSPENKVVDKRGSDDESSTRRRRECFSCKKRFTTYERPELVELTVIKKDGRREAFDRNKIIKGLVSASEKTALGREKIERAADEIEAEIRNEETKEVNSRKIGELVMRKLKKLDKIAYIRFASVYKEFADLESFEEELGKLLNKKSRKNRK